jgi:2-phosphosulfolactate phosphatase
MPVVTFRVGAQGAREAALQRDVCIVIDVLRASSTIITALDHGYTQIIPIAGLDSVPANQIVAGEADGAKLDGCHFGNSPLEIKQQPAATTPLYLYTTNGTACIRAAAHHNDRPVFIGALLNQTAVAKRASEAAHQHQANISIILASYRGSLEMDDWVAGSAILADIPQAELTGDLAALPLANIAQQVWSSPSATRLAKLGYKADIDYCTGQNIVDFVPLYHQGVIIAQA